MEPSESSASPVWAIYPASGNPSTKEQMWRTLFWKIPSVFPHGIGLHKIGPNLSSVVLIRSPFHIKSIITYFPSKSWSQVMANKIEVRCPQRACPPLHVLGSSPQSRKPTMWSMRGHMHYSHDWWKRRQRRLWGSRKVTVIMIKWFYFSHWNDTS